MFQIRKTDNGNYAIIWNEKTIYINVDWELLSIVNDAQWARENITSPTLKIEEDNSSSIEIEKAYLKLLQLKWDMWISHFSSDWSDEKYIKYISHGKEKYLPSEIYQDEQCVYCSSDSEVKSFWKNFLKDLKENTITEIHIVDYSDYELGNNYIDSYYLDSKEVFLLRKKFLKRIPHKIKWRML